MNINLPLTRIRHKLAFHLNVVYDNDDNNDDGYYNYSNYNDDSNYNNSCH